MFYRPAKIEDFEHFKKHFDTGHPYITKEIKGRFHEEAMPKLLKSIRERTGYSLQELKKYYDQYRAYEEALKDFQDGKQVFVKY